MAGDDDATPPPTGASGSSASEASKLIYGDELYLHPNDSSITNFVNIKLKETGNYNVWSCAMTLALSTKKKIGFINRKCKKPIDKSLANQWDLCNSIFLSWILGSISQDLYLGQCFSTSPKEVWDELQETYDKVNGSETFNLHHQINSLKQNETHVSDYYHTLNDLWRQFDAITKLPAYVKIAFSLISREESHRGSSSGSAGTKVSVFAAKKVPTSPSTQLTPEQIQQLLNLLNSKPAKNVQANMAEYTVNLLSVHKLARDSKLFIGFDEYNCYIQDLNLKKTTRIGSQQGDTESEDNDGESSVSSSISNSISESLDNDATTYDITHSSIDDNIVELRSTSEGYVDSDWAKCKATKRSVRGFSVFFGKSLVSWKSKKQTVVVRSSAEAEYRALTTVTCEIMWLLNLLRDFKLEFEKVVPIFCDNKAALQITVNHVTKHFEIDLHFVRDKIIEGIIKPSKIESANNLADMFTKGLFAYQLTHLLEGLNMFDPFKNLN
ncbi:putative transcription factor interactor and regulator CCHC(Zn) family protein [Tanacetum coccineum]